MSKDYKNASSSGGGGSSSSGVWGFLFGGVIGVLATALLLPRPGPEDCPALQTPAAADCPEKPAIRVPTVVEPEYDFYHLLPKLEVVVPTAEQPKPVRTLPQTSPQAQQQAQKPRDIPPAAPVSDNHTYLIQAGSFQTTADADRQRAKLALLGFKSEIQAAAIDANTTWHRVRIGPYRDSTELNAVRNRLSSEGIDSLLIRVN